MMDVARDHHGHGSWHVAARGELETAIDPGVEPQAWNQSGDRDKGPDRFVRDQKIRLAFQIVLGEARAEGVKSRLELGHVLRRRETVIGGRGIKHRQRQIPQSRHPGRLEGPTSRLGRAGEKQALIARPGALAVFVIAARQKDRRMVEQGFGRIEEIRPPGRPPIAVRRT